MDDRELAEKLLQDHFVIAAVEHYQALLRDPNMDVPNRDFDQMVVKILDQNAREHARKLEAAVQRLDLFIG